MKLHIRSWADLRFHCAVLAMAMLAACGGGGGAPGFALPPAPPQQPQQPTTPDNGMRTLGGSVVGLAGGGLVLQNNGADGLAVSGNGSFRFAQQVAKGTAYAVTVKAQPSGPAQTCTVNNAAGTAGDADIDSVRVTCSTHAFTVGGNVSGLTGTGLVLQNNAGDDITLGADAGFVFATPVASGAAYAVTVKQQPAGLPAQTCTVNNGSGTIADAGVSNVSVVCAVASYPVRLTVSGLDGQGLVLQNNLGDDLGVAADGAVAFATPVASGANYAVTVKTQPTLLAQTCTVANGAGTVANAPPDVAVTCAVPAKSRYAYFLSTALNISMVETFRVDAGIRERIGSTVAGLTKFTSIVAHPMGKFLFSAGEDGYVRSHAIDPATGSPAFMGTLPAVSVGGWSTLAVDPGGRVLYAVTAFGQLMSFRIEADGTLTLIGNVFAGPMAGAISVAVDPQGRFVYVASEVPSSIFTFRVGPDGGCTEGGVASGLAPAPVAIAADPSGRYLYVAGSQGLGLQALVLNPANGTLLPGGFAATESSRFKFAVEPRGRAVWVIDDRARLYTYQIGAGGAPVLQSTRQFDALGLGPLGFDAEGKAFYLLHPAGASASFSYTGDTIADPVRFNTPNPQSMAMAGW